MTRQQLQNLAEAAPFFLVATVIRHLPRTRALQLGRQLGRIARYLQPQRARTALENLRQAYPEKDSAWLKQQQRQVFEHLGISGMEMLRLDTFKTRHDVERYFTFEGLHHLAALKENNQGAFVLSGHIGFWEIGTFFMPKLGYPVDFVAKKIRNPYVDRFFERQRQAAGGRCLDSKHGARRILRSLSDKRFVCLLLDQHVSKKQGIIVDFFKRPAYATPIIAQIALKTKTPVVPVFVYRNPDFSYRVVISQPIIFDEPATPDAIQRCSQRLTDIIEAAIRCQPDQWFWVHRRWRKTAEIK